MAEAARPVASSEARGRAALPGVPALLLACTLLPGSAHADLDIGVLLKQEAASRAQAPAAPAAPLSSPAPAAAAPRAPVAAARDPQALYERAVALDRPGASETEVASAVRLFQEAAEQGHAGAQTALGLMYAQGHGVARDDRSASRLLLLAAGQNDSLAQYNIGLMYYEGRGVPRSFGKAIEFYELAARGGNAKAMNNIGIMHALGNGVAEDNIEAYAWFAAAAAAGDADAGTNRDLVANELSASQRGQAQDRARKVLEGLDSAR